MTTQLVLNLDETLVTESKAYAEKENTNLSDLIEKTLKKIIHESEPTNEYMPTVKKLSGIISEEQLQTINYTDYLERKYD